MNAADILKNNIPQSKKQFVLQPQCITSVTLNLYCFPLKNLELSNPVTTE